MSARPLICLSRQDCDAEEEAKRCHCPGHRKSSGREEKRNDEPDESDARKRSKPSQEPRGIVVFGTSVDLPSCAVEVMSAIAGESEG